MDQLSTDRKSHFPKSSENHDLLSSDVHLVPLSYAHELDENKTQIRRINPWLKPENIIRQIDKRGKPNTK